MAVTQSIIGGASASTFFDAWAAEYDQIVSGLGAISHRVAVGLMFPFLERGAVVLDLGVGTGLCAELLKANSQVVIGMDISNEMLKICAKKDICDQVVLHDLSVQPYPMLDQHVNHVVAAGVLNHCSDLAIPFSEISRIIKPGGIFCFNVDAHWVQKNNSSSFDVAALATPKTDACVPSSYIHEKDHVTDLLQVFGFDLMHSFRYESYRLDDVDVIARIFLCRKA